MRILYRQIFHREIEYRDNGGNKHTIENRQYGFSVKYGIPKDDEIKINNWNEMCRYFKYSIDFNGYKNRKGLYLEFKDFNDNKTTKVYSHEFLQMTEYFTFKKVEDKDTNISELMKELSLDEFLLYAENNNISIMK